MGKRNKKQKEPQEKAITGYGAYVEQLLKGDGFVKCVCIVACASHGYHDEGDKVFIKRELLEGDPFFRAHFKALEPPPEGQRRQDGEGSENGEGTQSQATEHNGDADGDELFKNSAKGPQGDPKGAPGENADGADVNESDNGEGQGELGLK